MFLYKLSFRNETKIHFENAGFENAGGLEAGIRLSFEFTRSSLQ